MSQAARLRRPVAVSAFLFCLSLQKAMSTRFAAFRCAQPSRLTRSPAPRRRSRRSGTSASSSLPRAGRGGLSVALRDDHFLDARALGGEGFFLQARRSGSTRPRRVISPVIATSCRTGLLRNSDASAVNIATPALGRPSGSRRRGRGCGCRSRRAASRSMPSLSARERIRLNAAVADSFITSPIWPVRVMRALAGHAGGFDEEDLAADGRVGHAGRDAGHAGALASSGSNRSGPSTFSTYARDRP